MEIINFKLENQEYIELVRLLKYEGIVQTGGEVKIMLQNEIILYNGEIEYRKKKKLYQGDIIIIDNQITLNII